MNQNINHTIPKSAFLLLPVLALAFYMAFIPHQTYPYPLHLDEWIHMARSEAIIQAGSTTYLDPLGGMSMSNIGTNLEAGFQVFWGIFHQISGIPWPIIFRYFPAIVFVFTVFSTYIFARRLGFGWEAALFTCLIPTTVGILGPAFLVPVATGLLFIPLSLFVAFNFRSVWSYLVLFIFTCFLLAIHAPSAICLVIIIFPYILLNLKSNFKHSLGIFVTVIVPFLAPFPWIFDMLLPTAKELLIPKTIPGYIDIPMVLQDYGYIPVALCILGTFILAKRSGYSNYGLVLGLLALLSMLVTFYTFHYGLNIMYERGLMFMMLAIGIVAGAGLMGIKNLALPEIIANKIGMPLIMQNLGKFLSLALAVSALAIIIPERQDIPYYHIIDTKDYQAFVWMKENIGDEHEKAILNPWKGGPFIAITGKKIQSWVFTAPKPKDIEVYNFLEASCTDTGFLLRNGISIVYTTGSCQNPDLEEIRENVYLLKDTR